MITDFLENRNVTRENIHRHHISFLYEETLDYCLIKFYINWQSLQRSVVTLNSIEFETGGMQFSPSNQWMHSKLMVVCKSLWSNKLNRLINFRFWFDICFNHEHIKFQLFYVNYWWLQIHSTWKLFWNAFKFLICVRWKFIKRT